MLQLIDIFKSEPYEVPEEIIATWNNLGPFDFESLVKEGKVKLSEEEVIKRVADIGVLEGQDGNGVAR